MWICATAVVSGCVYADGTDDENSTNEMLDVPFIPSDEFAQFTTDDADAESEVGKADGVLPSRFDLLATQSPVRDQGRRGSCATFAAVAITEHMYRKLGVFTNPDFSEQFVFWNTHGIISNAFGFEGSTPGMQLDAIAQDGVPMESTWPYELDSWKSTPATHPECVGLAPLSLSCVTNGLPPELALSSTHYRGGFATSVRKQTEELKAYMFNHGDPVAIAMFTLHTAWFASYHSREGIVTLPTARTFPPTTGHVVVAVGWDDNMRAARLDADGNPELDADGNPIEDEGFLLVRNSWGTTGWGQRNSRQPGYGWISYRYWNRFGTLATAAHPPGVASRIENCSNGSDDNGDGRVDCDDRTCTNTSACAEHGSSTLEFLGPASIPDNSEIGLRTTAYEPRGGAISVSVFAIQIQHPFSGDLEITLVHPSGRRALLRRNSGTRTVDVREPYITHEFDGLDADGAWAVVVKDLATGDVGTLRSWSLVLRRQLMVP